MAQLLRAPAARLGGSQLPVIPALGSLKASTSVVHPN